MKLVLKIIIMMMLMTLTIKNCYDNGDDGDALHISVAASSRS
jgi:hypothetical protein